MMEEATEELLKQIKLFGERLSEILGDLGEKFKKIYIECHLELKAKRNVFRAPKRLTTKQIIIYRRIPNKCRSNC